MKALNIIICLLAVTLFVACSKKKDGYSNPYYPNGTYGLVPNDIHTGYINNGMYQTGIVPGYQLPQSCGSGQMFSDALSYCGWLATEGESVCNPLVVKQIFLQYCQAFAVQFNYCVPQVQSGCYYGSGCSFGSTTIRYHDRKRPRDDIDQLPKGKLGVVYSPAPPAAKPGVVYSPAPTPAPAAPTANCYADKNRDCELKNPNKKNSTELICKLPNESANAIKYYDYNQYLDIVKKLCSNNASTVSNGPEELPTVNLEPGKTTPTTVDTTQAPQKAKRVYIMPEDLPKTTTAKKAEPTQSVTECLNLQKLHEAIIDPNNHLSSIRLFMNGKLLNKSSDKKFNTKFVETVRSGGSSVYYGNVEGRPSNNLSAIGYNVKQTKSSLKIFDDDKQSGIFNSTVGKILSCDEKILVAEFKTPYGTERDTFTWNGLMDDDFEMILTRNGTFKYSNKEDSYIISNYIGLAKDMKDLYKKDDQIIHKQVQSDMESKGFKIDISY